MKIALIVALSKNNVMGDSSGLLLWHLGDDLKNFKELTLNQVVIMGRRTYDSIGHILAHRVNIVITSSDITARGLIVAKNPEEALALAYGYDKDIFIIGGKSVYENLVEFVDTLYVTRVDTESTGNIIFNPLEKSDAWQLVEQLIVGANQQNDHNFTTTKYHRYRKI